MQVPPAHADGQKLEIIPPPVLTATAGQPFSATFTATVPVKWKVKLLPSWLTVQTQDPEHITVSGTPPSKGNADGEIDAKALGSKHKKAKAPFTIVVNSSSPTPDFTLQVTPTVQTITAGGAGATYTVRVIPENGFNDPVSLLPGIPPGLIVNYPSTVTLDAPASVMVSAPSGFTPGRYTVTLTGTAQGVSLVHSTSLDVIVEAKPKTVPLSIVEERFPDMYEHATQTVTLHATGGSAQNLWAIVPATTDCDFCSLESVRGDSIEVKLNDPGMSGIYTLGLAVTDENNPSNHTEKLLRVEVLSTGENNGVSVNVDGTSFKDGDVMQIKIHYDAGKAYPYNAIVMLENANGPNNRYSEMVRIVNNVAVITGPDSIVSWKVAYPTNKCEGTCNNKRFRIRVIVLDSIYQQQHQFEFPAGTSADVTLQ